MSFSLSQNFTSILIQSNNLYYGLHIKNGSSQICILFMSLNTHFTKADTPGSMGGSPILPAEKSTHFFDEPKKY